jgi:hypothetical protein
MRWDVRGDVRRRWFVAVHYAPWIALLSLLMAGVFVGSLAILGLRAVGL